MKQSWMIFFLTISLTQMTTSFLHSEGIETSLERVKSVYIKDGLTVKRLTDFETNILVTISLELTISNKK